MESYKIMKKYDYDLQFKLKYQNFIVNIILFNNLRFSTYCNINIHFK